MYIYICTYMSWSGAVRRLDRAPKEQNEDKLDWNVSISLSLSLSLSLSIYMYIHTHTHTHTHTHIYIYIYIYVYIYEKKIDEVARLTA